MNVNSLYRLASLLDTEGKYLEADVVLDSMMRLAAPDGRGTTQGRPRPRNLNPRLTPEQVRARLKPNAPVAPAAPQTLVPPDNLPRSDSGDYLDKRPVPKKPLIYKPTDPLQIYEPPAKPAAPATPAAQPATPNPETPTTRTKPVRQGIKNQAVRKYIWNNPQANPRLRALLELEQAAGRFNPETGELAESAIETLSRAYEKIGPSSSAASRGGRGAQIGAKAVEFANRARNAPGTQSIANALGKMGKTLSFLKPLTKLLPFLGFALSIPDFVRLCNRINQEGWEPIWNDPYDRAKAIGAISNTVAAAVSIAPGPLTPVAAALAAIGMGSDLGADVARDAGDAVEGGEFKLFGKTLKSKSKERQQQDAFEAGYNAKTIDPQVQSALDASKRMFMVGSKITETK